jgi:ABC-type phosphate/phosphonate transport system substrate-binding protein
MTPSRRQFLAASAAAMAAPLLAADKEVPLTLLVTDPLSKELSCPCVEGYAQRDYKELAKHLTAKLGKPVVVEFGESLEAAMKKTAGRVDVIIGKDSVIRAQSKAQKLEIVKLAGMTGKEGDLTQHGVLVVHSSDPTLSVDQLKEHKILFGPPAAEEKNAAAKALLKDLNVTYTAMEKDAVTCSVCATQLLEYAKTGEKVVGVISSYAVPLLEGCGTVKKGDLKVIGKTDQVPFISAFVVGAVPADVQKKLQVALLEVAKDEALCKVLETKDGFVETDQKGLKKK